MNGIESGLYINNPKGCGKGKKLVVYARNITGAPNLSLLRSRIMEIPISTVLGSADPLELLVTIEDIK